MIKKLHFKVLLLMATLVFGVGNVWGADTYTLVKSASELSEGDVILITSSKTNGKVVGGLMGAQSGNNCPGVDVTISDKKITSLGEGQEITLETKNASGYFNMKVGDSAYLYAANSSSGKNNYLKTKDSNSIYWSIEINSSTYAATIKDMVSSCNNRNWLRYNSSSSLFSCYGSGQADVYVFKKVVAPAHTITAVSNNEDWGEVSLLGTIITASPKAGYRVVAGDGGYTVTAGTATVVNNGNNTFTVTPTSDCTVRINFEAIPTHKANFSVNGVVSSKVVEEGAVIDFPDDPDDLGDPALGGKKFVGWAANPISGSTNVEPAFVTSAVMETENVTYYAVFATLTPGDAKTVEDELTRTTTGVANNAGYNDWSNKTATSDAVYKGQSAGGNNAIQLRSDNSNSGIVTTTSGGKVKKVVLTWNSSTTAGRTVNVYGSNTPYTNPTDLYDAEKQGTELGTIVKGTSTELNITGDYAYVGLRSASGALYLTKVAITWETGTPDAYSAYCTSAVPVEITDAGFATYCSAYALDFSGVAGLTAYKAKMNGTTVEFKEVSDMPAEKGVLVKGAKATYYVPVVDSSSTDVSDNVLVGTVGGTTINGNDADYFVLKKNTAGVGFYRVTAANYNVRANSAYLALAKGGTGAKGFIPVDGTTAIDLVDTANEVAAPAYNLQGQRVSNGYKGVVIVNGKKIIK